MNSNSVPLMFILLAIAVILTPPLTDGKCNSCGDNGIACVNETSFQMCFGSDPDTTQTFSCPPNKICSHLSLKCIDADMGMDADCNPGKGCGVCDGTKMFACTSRTTFVQCHGTEVTTNTGVCPKGLTCDSSNVEVCINECNLVLPLECDRETPL